MELLDKNLGWLATITWSRPILYENAKTIDRDIDNSSFFYTIHGNYSKYKPKLFYIGKTYSQFVKTRLNQKDHVERYKLIKKKYPRFKLYVSFGSIELENGNINRKRIDEIESLLIYSHSYHGLENKNKLYTLNVNEQYKIVNKGYRSTLYKEIVFGVFVK